MNSKYVVWGIPREGGSEQILYTKAVTREGAITAKTSLENVYGCTSVRIQEINPTENPAAD